MKNQESKIQSKNQRDEFKRRLYNFVLRLLKFVGSLQFNAVTKVLIDELIRSGTSVLGNYIEAGSSSSRKDYINFFNHCLKSANESRVWLALLRDTDNGDKQEITWLLSELEEISKIFASSIITLKG